MSSELVAIDSLTKLIYRYPSFYGMEKFDQGVPVIRGEHIGQDGRISTNWGDYWFVTPEYSAQYPKTILAADDIVMSVRGTVGLFARVTESHVGAQISPNLIRLSPDPLKVYPPYFYYALRDERVVAQIAGSVASSAVPALKASDIKSAKIRVLPREQQVSAATALRALDDRITLLRETNVTLEAIAQALFKSWFVDFDPVRAKMEGRAPEGMDEATAALFPDALEETELGPVPKGWRVVRLDSFIELTYGKALKAENRKAGQVPVYGSGGITGWHDQALVEQASIIVGRKGTVGSLYWESRPFFPIDTVFYVKSQKPLIYCHLLLKTLGLDSMNTDAAVPGLNRENVYRLLVTEPTRNVLTAFDNIASALRRSMDENERKAQTLNTLRDTLLPRLISGQLRVPEATLA